WDRRFGKSDYGQVHRTVAGIRLRGDVIAGRGEEGHNGTQWDSVRRALIDRERGQTAREPGLRGLAFWWRRRGRRWSKRPRRPLLAPQESTHEGRAQSGRPSLCAVSWMPAPP